MLPTASDNGQRAPSLAIRDLSMLSEDEQVAYAMQMSMYTTSGGQLSLGFYPEYSGRERNEIREHIHIFLSRNTTAE